MTTPKQDIRSGKEDGHDMEDHILLSTFESYIIFDLVCTFRSLSGNVLDLFSRSTIVVLTRDEKLPVIARAPSH